ncbi:MAG: S9 family peptidase [Gemmatimonadaceae bacterium]
MSQLTLPVRAALLAGLMMSASVPAALRAQAPAARPAAASATPRAFTPADWYRVTTLSSPAVSPDGRRVAVTVTTVRESENKRHSEIWVVPTAGGEPARYTSPGTESSNPRWSPDGSYIFFNSQRPGGKGAIWALRMDAPGGEAVQLPDYPNGSTPADRRFAVWSEPVPRDSSAADSSSRSSDPFSRMGATARPPFGAITRPQDSRRFDGRHIVDMGYKANGRGFVANRREAREYRPSQIWLRAFDGSAKRALTSTNYSHRGAVVSPDGRTVAFLADARLRADSVVETERDSLGKLRYDAAREAEVRNDMDIFLLDVEGGEAPRRLAELPGSEGDLIWSPDGKSLAYTARATRTAPSRLYVIGASGGTPRELLGDWAYEPDEVTWLPDGDLLMEATIGGSTAIFRVNPKTGARKEIVGGRRRIMVSSTDSRGKVVAFVSTSTAQPTELFVVDADGRNERKLTSFNDALMKEVAFADAERFTYKSVGDREIEAWLMKPYGYEEGKKYPLVLYVHGGPHSAYGENWFDEFQNIAGAGMWVLYTNPRGSSGYGSAFTYETRGRWGAEDYQDIMKAVDIASVRPDVDSTRMGITGGSYGGFMTAWVTTKTDRFKAAQADRMISNWWSWYGASDAQGLTEFEFYGKPWENPAMYDTLSPIRYVDRVKTPTLIVQSEEDHRTPIADAEQWFAALEKLDVPVEFVRYPRSTHDLSRTGEPWLLVDRLGRLRQWFGYWLQDQKPRDVANQ